MKKLLLYFICFVILEFNADAQAEINKDSLLKVINTAPEDSNKAKLYFILADQYLETDLNETERISRSGLVLSRKLKYRQGELDYYTLYGSILNSRGDFNGYLKINLEAVEFAKKYADSSEIARTLFNVGIANRQLGDYETAVNYIETAKDIWIREDVHQYDGAAFNLLQLLYYSMHQYKRGVSNGLYAIKAIEKTGNRELLLKAYNNLGMNYIFTQQYDSAKYYLNMAAIEAKRTGDYIIQITTNLNFALISVKLYQWDSIKLFAGNALMIAKNYGAREHEGLAQYGMAYYYLLKKEYPNSALFADSALVLANQYNMPDLKQKLYALLSSLYYAKQNTELGYSYFTQYEILNDSILNMSVVNSTIRTEKKFDTERKETQIKLQDAQLKQKNNLIYFLVAGAIALLAISLLSYRNYRSRQKLQQLKIDELETEQQLLATEAVLKGEEQERTRLAKDLHDGLGGMLSGIKYSLSNMKENLIMTPDNVQAFERSIDMLDSSIREMRRVAHNMMPEILIKYGLDIALKEFCNEIDRSGVIHTNYQSIDMDKTTVSQTTAVTVYRIVQELVNNAIKHAGAENVLVQAHISEAEKLLALTVEDDGKGFDITVLKQSSGIGWSNIQNRVEFLKGKIDISSEPGKGTSVLIEINI